MRINARSRLSNESKGVNLTIDETIHLEIIVTKYLVAFLLSERGRKKRSGEGKTTTTLQF